MVDWLDCGHRLLSFGTSSLESKSGLQWHVPFNMYHFKIIITKTFIDSIEIDIIFLISHSLSLSFFIRTRSTLTGRKLKPHFSDPEHVVKCRQKKQILSFSVELLYEQKTGNRSNVDALLQLLCSTHNTRVCERFYVWVGRSRDVMPKYVCSYAHIFISNSLSPSCPTAVTNT